MKALEKIKNSNSLKANQKICEKSCYPAIGSQSIYKVTSEYMLKLLYVCEAYVNACISHFTKEK